MDVDNMVEECKETRPNSRELHERVVHVFAAGTTTWVRIMNPY